MYQKLYTIFIYFDLVSLKTPFWEGKVGGTKSFNENEHFCKSQTYFYELQAKMVIEHLYFKELFGAHKYHTG